MASKSLDLLVKNIQKKLSDLERRPSWLAEKSGVSKAMISRILSLETNPTLGTVESIAKALNTSLEELLGPSPFNNPSAYDERIAFAENKLRELRLSGDKSPECLEAIRIIENDLAQNIAKQSAVAREDNHDLRDDLIFEIGEQLHGLDSHQLETVKMLVDNLIEQSNPILKSKKAE